MGSRFAKNMLYSAVGWLVPSIAAFFAIPVIVRGLGAYGYGVLALVGTIAGFLNLMDLGFGQGVVRFVAVFVTRGDGRAIRECIRVVLAWFLLVGALGAVALWVLAPWLASTLLKAPAATQPEAIAALRIGGIAFAINMIAGVVSPVPQAFLRYDFVGLLSGTLISLGLIGPAILVSFGHGLIPVLWFQVGLGGLACLLWGVAAGSLVRSVPDHGRGFRESWPGFLRFSLTSALNQVVSVADLQTGRLVLASAGGAEQLGYFQIPSVLAGKVRELLNRMAMVLLPTGAQMAADDDHRGVSALYERSSRLFYILNASVAGAVIVFSAPLLTYWVSVDFGSRGALALQLLTVAGAVNATSMAASYLNLALGRPRVNLAFSCLNSAVSLGLVYWLTVSFGITGTALTALLASLVAPFFLYYSQRYVLAISSWRIFLNCYARTTVAVGTVAVASWFLLLPNAKGLMLTVALTGVVTAAGIALSAVVGGVTPADWGLLREALRFGGTSSTGPEPGSGGGGDE